MTDPIVKVLTIREPYATALVRGVKRYETRSRPPHGLGTGPGLPGLPLAVGERCYVHAAAAPPKAGRYGGWQVQTIRNGRRVIRSAYDGTFHHGRYPNDSCAEAGHNPGDHFVPLRPGHIVGSFVLAGVIPIVGDGPDYDRHWGDRYFATRFDGTRLYLFEKGCGHPVQQEAWGFWNDGWWAWEVADPRPLDACPLCGTKPGDALVNEHFADGEFGPCRVCGGAGLDGPVKATGRLGVWRL